MKTPANVVECACPLATLEMMREINAVTMLPESAANENVLSGVLKRVPLISHRNGSTFGILLSRERLLNTSAKKFLETLRRFAKEEQERSKPPPSAERRTRECSEVSPIRAEATSTGQRR
jgi:DNA-binding transcriptional LysR family regulator